MGKSPGLKLQASIVQDNVPVEVAPRLFVGSIHAAFNIDALKEFKITHVLNLAGNYATFPEDFTYLSISMRDKEYTNLLSCLPVALLFIGAALAKREDGDEGGILVHCAGGRSRSPAIVAAYLMAAHGVSVDEALTRIRHVRPVTCLNSGFAAQLRCLEQAQCDVFTAHQLILQRQLKALTQQREDGLLDTELSKKKRRPHQRSKHHHHHHSHHHSGLQSPRTPKNADDDPEIVTTSSPHELAAAAACDERGMIHSRVPSGFSLSLQEDYSSKGARFIPTLCSMGSLYGCKSCGENLFCASAFIATCQAKEQGKTDKCDKVSEQVLGDGEKQKPTSVPASTTKRPLLAKLRLRPQSPSVSAKNAGKQGNATHADASTTPRSAVLKTTSSKLAPPTSPQYQQNVERQRHHAGDDAKPHSHGSTLWRSLTSFKSSSSKRSLKESAAAVSSCEMEDEKNKKAITSPKAIAIDLSAAGDADEEDEIQRKFLSTNAKHWETGIHQVEEAWTSNPKTYPASSKALCSTQLSKLLSRDLNHLTDLETSKQWLLAPQDWFMTPNLLDSNGSIACPNEKCVAVLGRYDWDGVACPCGCGNVTLPAFQLERTALRKLGNVVTPPRVHSGEMHGLGDN